MKKQMISFRVTKQEYDLLQERTIQAGIRNQNLSEYVRRQALGEAYPYVREKLLREMNYRIRKIGVNINQISARNNSGLYLVSDREQLKKEMEALLQVFERFQDTMKNC